jgi:hypothetical protein
MPIIISKDGKDAKRVEIIELKISNVCIDYYMFKNVMRCSEPSFAGPLNANR